MTNILVGCSYVNSVFISIYVKTVTYVGEDTIGLLVNAALQAEGEVVAADHDAAAETLLEGLHVWLDAREVQPLDVGRGGGGRDKLVERKGDQREREEGGQIRKIGSTARYINK